MASSSLPVYDVLSRSSKDAVDFVEEESTGSRRRSTRGAAVVNLCVGGAGQRRLLLGKSGTGLGTGSTAAQQRCSGGDGRLWRFGVMAESHGLL